jgi:hypothetical protein
MGIQPVIQQGIFQNIYRSSFALLSQITGIGDKMNEPQGAVQSEAKSPNAIGEAKTDIKATSTPAQVAGKVDEPTREIKVDGKVYKVTDKQLVAMAQKGMFADQKLKSMDVLKTTSEKLISKLKTPEGIVEVLKDPTLGNSPKEVLRKLLGAGIIDDELKEDLSKWVYDNVVVQAKKTPEQIETEKKLSDYERLKKQEEDNKQKDVLSKQQEQVQQVYQAVRAEVTKQILADKTFPQNEYSIRQVVEKLRVMNKSGAPLTAENVTKALGFVKNDFIAHQTAILDAFDDPEGLIAAIGEPRALKISRALVARLQNKAKVTAKEEKKEDGPRKKVTDRIDEKLGRTPHGYSVMDV